MYEFYFAEFTMQGISHDDSDMTAEIKTQDLEVGEHKRTKEQTEFMKKVEGQIGSRQKQRSSSSLLRGDTTGQKSANSVIKQFGF